MGTFNLSVERIRMSGSVPPQGPGGPRPPVYSQPPRPYSGPPGGQGPPASGQVVGVPGQGPPMGGPGGMRPYHAGGVPNAPGGPMMSTGAPSGPGVPVGGVPRPGSKRPVDIRGPMVPGPPVGPGSAAAAAAAAAAASKNASSKKKRRLADKILPQKVRELVPESQAYMDLLQFERKLDSTIMRKRLDIQEALKRPMKQKRKLRIFISNTSFPAKEGEGDEQSVASWE